MTHCRSNGLCSISFAVAIATSNVAGDKLAAGWTAYLGDTCDSLESDKIAFRTRISKLALAVETSALHIPLSAPIQ